MRKFAAICPTVWQSDLKRLRGDLEAQVVYWHLTTSNHSTMIGLYVLPIPFLVHETGCPSEGALKGLQRVCEAGIASYDDVNEIVWVHEMAANQIAPRLSPKDNKVVAVAKQLSMLPICQITLGFYGRYRDVFHLSGEPTLEEYERSYEGASEPLRSKEKDKDLGEGEGQIGLGGEKSLSHERNQMFTPFPIPSSAAKGRSFLIAKGVSRLHLDGCLRSLLGGNLTPYDLEGFLDERVVA